MDPLHQIAPRSPELDSSSYIDQQWRSAEAALGAYVRAEIPNRHDAEDVLQNIAEALLTSLSRYDPERSFTSWAFGIARNHVLRHAEARGRKKLRFSSELVDGLAAAFESQSIDVDARRVALQSCLQKVGERQRRVIHLRYELGLSQKEVAKRLEATPASIGVLLHRTRLALKECIRLHCRRSEYE